jgi:peroxiredoxin
LGAFQAQVPQFEALGVKVIGLSIDHKFAQKAFAEQVKLSFPLMADANREVSPALGTLLPEVAGIKQVNMRAALLIDRTMTLRWKFGVDTATQPSVPEVLEHVKTLLAAEEAAG